MGQLLKGSLLIAYGAAYMAAGIFHASGVGLFLAAAGAGLAVVIFYDWGEK